MAYARSLREQKTTGRGVKRKQGYGAEDPDVSRTRQRMAEALNRATDAEMEDGRTETRDSPTTSRLPGSSA